MSPDTVGKQKFNDYRKRKQNGSWLNNSCLQKLHGEASSCRGKKHHQAHRDTWESLQRDQLAWSNVGVQLFLHGHICRGWGGGFISPCMVEMFVTNKSSPTSFPVVVLEEFL